MNIYKTGDLNLIAHRTAKGISLGWIESSTKIGLHFLQAIEAEDFAKLPGGVYAVSYLRQYAREIGFDEAALLSRYYETIRPPAPAEAPTGGRFSPWLQPLRAFLTHLPRRQESRNHA